VSGSFPFEQNRDFSEEIKIFPYSFVLVGGIDRRSAGHDLHASPSLGLSLPLETPKMTVAWIKTEQQ